MSIEQKSKLIEDIVDILQEQNERLNALEDKERARQGKSLVKEFEESLMSKSEEKPIGNDDSYHRFKQDQAAYRTMKKEMSDLKGQLNELENERERLMKEIDSLDDKIFKHGHDMSKKIFGE